MLSILIPTFNYDCRQLVSDLHRQVTLLNIDFEIRVYDDCSTDSNLREINNSITELNFVIFTKLTENLGFCKIRNKLARDSKFDQLIFVDADIQIENNFIANYLSDTSANVQCGGIIYNSHKPINNALFLKWKHGKTREELTAEQRNKKPFRTLSAANLYIKKEVYLNAKMDEESTGYGYNDTMLGYNLKLINCSINHINNPVLHEGLMDAEKFIKRSMEAMKNLVFFENQSYIRSDFKSFIKVLNVYYLLKKTLVAKWFLSYYLKNKSKWIANLKSKNPNLKNLDKLKLGRLIELKSEIAN